jgi:hypothetical protein
MARDSDAKPGIDQVLDGLDGISGKQAKSDCPTCGAVRFRDCIPPEGGEARRLCLMCRTTWSIGILRPLQERPARFGLDVPVYSPDIPGHRMPDYYQANGTITPNESDD